MILDKINSVADQYAPYHERWIAPNNIINEPWMSKAMSKSSKKKLRLYKKSIGCGKDSQESIRYKNYHNMFNCLKLHLKREYLSDHFTKSKGDSKKIWGTIWYLTNKFNDKNDNNAIVNAFNKHFSNIGKDIKRQIPTVNKSYQDYLQKKKSVEKLLLNPITETEILKAII